MAGSFLKLKVEIVATICFFSVLKLRGNRTSLAVLFLCDPRRQHSDSTLILDYPPPEPFCGLHFTVGFWGQGAVALTARIQQTRRSMSKSW